MPLPSPPTADLRIVQDVSRLILTVAQRLQDNFAAHASKLGLSALQAKLLIALPPGESVPMRVLAERLRCDPSNLTGLVDKLESRDIVRRRPDPVDRRVKALTLTDDGVELRSAFWSRMISDAGPLAHLSVDQLHDLRDHLRVALDE